MRETYQQGGGVAVHERWRVLYKSNQQKQANNVKSKRKEMEKLKSMMVKTH